METVRQRATRRQREWRERAIAAGKCGACGVNDPRPGKVECQTCVDRKRAITVALEAKARAALYQHAGGERCACCGETEPLFLTLDHIADDGADHRRAISGKNGGASYRAIAGWMKRHGWPVIFQVLCMNCNMGKARNGGVCPHTTTTLTLSAP